MTSMAQIKSIKNFFKSKGEIVYQPIALDELNLDHYQRRTRYGKVKSIIKDFNPFLLGVILVSYRDGKYNVVDGGHRVAALRQMGAKTVMCQMVYGLTYEQEASLFLDFNCNRTGLTPNEKFAGAVEAKRKSALDIVSCLMLQRKEQQQLMNLHPQKYLRQHNNHRHLLQTNPLSI